MRVRPSERTESAFLAGQQPVISVDTKKKELVGDFKNGGRELRPKGEPEKVRVHDFPIPELGRATPYGVYDLARNTGWVSVGMDHDTAAFAVESIRRWWQYMGRPVYPEASRLLITADAGGDPLALWSAQRDMQNGAPLGDVDLVAREHGVDVLAQAGLLGQHQQQPHRLGGNAVLGVIEVETQRLQCEVFATLGILSEELPKVYLADLGTMLL
jgi:hypothetical protein